MSAPWGCDASLYTCERAADSRALLVGDAASFIEPLSSAGVKKALASAWRAAVVVNTVLTKPEMLDVALAFHDRRERWLYGECVRRSQTFFARAGAVYDDPFWSSRANYLPADLPGAAPTDAGIRNDRDGQRLAERLRDVETVRITATPGLVVGRAPVVDGNQIVLCDGLALDGFEEPVRFVCGVDLMELVRIVPHAADMSSVIEEHFRRVGRIDPRNLLLG